MIVYIILAGVSAGAVTAYGPLKGLSITFLIPIIGPLVITNILHFDVNHTILAVITSLFVYIIHSASTNLYKTFLNTLEQGITIRTLTEEKVRMEEMAKLKSDFFASMSHEIRTPLNGIVGLVDLLQAKGIDANQEKDYLTTIKKSSDDLLNVINDVLDLSKIESGKLSLLPKETSLSHFANRMVTLFSERANQKGLALKLNIDADIPNYITIDEHRLSQVTTNLLSNAIKFTDEGSIRFTIDVLKKNKDSIKLQFKVEDTGIGIPKEKHNIIFNKYDQIANATNYLVTQAGTGLGLSIAKKIVTLMEGTIGVFSKEKEGSIFWFTVEVPFSDSTKELKKIQNQKIEGKFNFNVLLVDDREINLKVASLMLKKLGCKVQCASNGEIAIQLYQEKQNEYDLIIMDIQMPILDGISATKKLRELYPNDLCPVYGLSAQIADNLHKTPEELGFDFYLTKPLALDTLKTSLKRLTRIS
jgi:signal transduction histidine kinase/CheY-like chemotaxis protein